MTSRIAKIRCITDQPNDCLWGSTPGEQEKMETIRREYADYLYVPEGKVPAELLERLGLLAEEIFAGTIRFDSLIAMYEEI